VACQNQNNLAEKEAYNHLEEREYGAFPNYTREFLPVQCQHCDNPPCVKVCPTRASHKRKDGVVLVDKDKCIGCKYCLASCPYNARYVNPLIPIVQKCYFCHHRVYAGLEPACVEVCPGKARVFGDLNNPDAEVTRLISRHPFQMLKPEMGTYPKVYYIAADADAMDLLPGGKDGRKYHL
jgi:tetrathionate reductase subunit B